MTTEEAAKAVVDAYDDHKAYDTVHEMISKAVKLFESVDALRTALSASPWVSVKERMPTEADGDHYGSILMLGINGSHFVHYWTIIAMFPDNYTHWMPIPPLPQQEG